MITDISEFVENLGKREMETQLALQCAPLIMRLKVANLFSVTRLHQEHVSGIFADTDFDVLRLGGCNGRVIFFVYHGNQLWQYLSNQGVRIFLRKYGYLYDELDTALAFFGKRYAEYLCTGRAFPHEMGVMLGYPLDDVKSFIHNKGQNYLYAGYWKVYHNLDDALKLFDSYDKAIAFVMELVTRGINATNILNICDGEHRICACAHSA